MSYWSWKHEAIAARWAHPGICAFAATTEAPIRLTVVAKEDDEVEEWWRWL